jgi:hypothetical protein
MPDSSPSTKSSGSFRWWEFYGVRYAMGTIVGSIVFYVLASGNALLKPLATDIKYLVSFGLVYCYIASAPILVFHAGRFLLKERHRGLGFLSAAAVGLVAGILGWLFIPRDHIAAPIFWLFLLAFAIAAFIWCLEGLVVCGALRQSDKLWTFYEKLSDHRANADKGEIIDSYRHLREHGNSFFIVSLEIILGTILIGISAAAGLFDAPATPEALKSMSSPTLDSRFVAPILAIVLWILPAVLVWFIATELERRFMDAPLPSKSRD